MSNKLNDLNDQLTTAKAALTQALIDGADTTAERHTIAQVEGEIAAHRQIQKDEANRLAEEQAAAVAKAAAELEDSVHADVETAATVAGLEELNGEALPALERSSEIDAAAQAVAAAVAAVERAEADYLPHAEKLSTLKKRLAEKIAAVDVIKQRRVSGQEQPDDAAQINLLSADTEELNKLVSAATAEAAAADKRQAAQASLASANQHLERSKHLATLAAAKTRAEQAEQIFLAAAAAAKVAAISVGGPVAPSMQFVTSGDLRKLVVGVR